MEIGCHFSLVDQKTWGNPDIMMGNAVQVFLKSTKSYRCKEFKESEINKIRGNIANIFFVVHSAYILKFCHPMEFDETDINYPKIVKYLEKSKLTPDEYKVRTRKAIDCYINDIQNLEKMIDGIKDPEKTGCILHLGSNVLGVSKDTAIQYMADTVIEVINRTPECQSQIIIETCAHQGNDICWNIEDLGILNHLLIDYQHRVKYCVDTCHVFAAGYDMRTKESFLEFYNLWENIIGWNRVIVIHLNDSKGKLGDKKDRHTTIGEGYIFNETLGGSLEGMKEMFRRCDIPYILETPNTSIAEILKVQDIVSNI